MWKYFLHSLLLLFFFKTAITQEVNFNFEDLKFTGWIARDINDWHVDTISPISGKASLHHNYDNDEAGIAYIQYPHDILSYDSLDAVWSFQLKYEYNPSSSNHWAIHLKDNSFVELSPNTWGNAYVLGVNYIGSDDYLTLWKQEGKTIEPIVQTNFNWEAELLKGKPIGISIHRTRLGEWQIYVDSGLNREWDTIGSGFDTTFKYSTGFGIYYKYTSSNDQILWLDGILIHGCFIADTLPPKIETFNIRSPKKLHLIFDEPVDTIRPFYCRLNRQDNLLKRRWLSFTELELEFTAEFGFNNLLELYSINDYEGNVAQILTLEFEYYSPVLHDILISEILPDPVPSAGLPEVEYVEIFNRSQYTIDLEDWQLSIGTNEVKLPSWEIAPKEYLVLTGFENALLFENNNTVLGVEDFPSLPNTGTSIILRSKAGRIVHSTKYESSYYHSQAKKEGGWSLELVDLSNPCLIESNWKESVSEVGGTPGKENSVLGSIKDVESPWVERISVTSENSLEILFSEPMDSLSISSKMSYSFPELGEAYSLKIADNFNIQSNFGFNTTLDEKEVYTIVFSEEIEDCSGNRMEESQILFGLPQIVDSGDIIINETLFEGTDEIPEFIEIYNNSDKIIDLRNIRLAFYDQLSNIPSDEITISSECLQLLPHDYIALTENKNQLRKYYALNPGQKVYEPADWKSLPNSGFKLALLGADNKIFDLGTFDNSMHSPLLTNTKGVSLERINSEKKGNSEDNWHSASSVSGYASPSAINSQHLGESYSSDVFSVNLKAISPNNDGVEDFLEIKCNLPHPGYYLSILIFNAEGDFITSIARNGLVGTEDVLTWDGTSDSGGLVPMGYYIIYLEAVNPKGGKLQKKETVVVLP